MTSLIALYLFVIICYNNGTSKRRSKTTKYSSTSTSPSISSSNSTSIPVEKEYKKIYLFVNTLNFVSNNYEVFRPDYVFREEVYDGENGLVSDEIEMALKRANSVGITDFLIPESTIDLNKLAIYQVFEALVKLSFSYNITINILLNEQFLIEPDAYILMSNNKFYSNSLKTVLSKQYGKVIDPSNPLLKNYIKDRIRKFSKCQMRNFYFGENPYYLIPENIDSNKTKIVEVIDYDLLYERAEFILNISDKIRLFYFYDFRLDRHNADRFRRNIKGPNYEGSLIYTLWDPFYMTIFSETFLTFLFQKLETEKKVILFYIKIIEKSIDYLDVVLGIYLFSPVPIVLMIQTIYALPLYNNILTNQPLLPHEMYAKVNEAYRWVLKIMKENPFFQNNPSLLEDVKLKDDVISAISVTKESGTISGLLFLLYNRQSRNFNIDLNQHFPGWLFQTFSILYDSVPRHKSYLLKQSGEINLLRQQILIIQPNLIF